MEDLQRYVKSSSQRESAYSPGPSSMISVSLHAFSNMSLVLQIPPTDKRLVQDKSAGSSSATWLPDKRCHG